VRLPFNPAEHGFVFSNSFTNHLLTIPALGIDFTTQGRCGGMAYAALDYWHNGLAVPDSAALPADGSLLGDYISARLVDSILANAWKFIHFMRTPDHPTWLNGIGVARATREEEYPRLKTVLDTGSPCVLGLTQARDLAGLGHDHQVVAYGYEDGARYSRVFIYDNNHPNQEVVLEFTTTYDPSEREIRESSGESPWRGFVVEGYAPQVPSFLADGRLLSDRSDPAIHVIRGGGRFHIPSPAEFDANGFDWHAVVEAQDGSMEHVATRPGNGTVVRERSQAAVYLVRGGRAFLVPDAAVFDALGLNPSAVRIIPDGSLGNLATAPVRDGTLLRELTDPRVYVARAGRLRHVPDMQTFEAEGFVAANVGLVPDGALGGVPKGGPLPSSHPNPTPIPRSWAERGSGQIATADGDQIDYLVQPGQKPASEVEFVLELGTGLTWRKELVLRDGAGGEWTIGVQDTTRSDRNGLHRDQLPAGSLLFRKAKMFGIMSDVHGLGNLDQLPAGARVTFTWRRD
jgi:hypothetical protein